MNRKRNLLYLLATPLFGQTPNVDMNIFVHGTIRPAEITLSSLIKIAREKIDNSLYSQATKYIREDPFFFQNSAIQGLGLKKIDMNGKTKSIGARLLAELYEQQWKHLNNTHNKNLYYTFGWSGLLSSSKRRREAQNLYDQLHQELDLLKQQNIHPRIRLIAFSHGGNVCMNLAKAQAESSFLQKQDLSIDELILFGTPIQNETDYLISSPMFKKIVHFYSTADSIQKLDFFSLSRFFSNRTFTKRRNFVLPKDLVQVRLRITKKIIGRHKIKDDIQPPYTIIAHKKIRRKHADPGHSELWCFSWGSYWYRKTFPLKPTPTVAFTPYLLASIQSYQEEPKKHIIIDICPTEGGILIQSAKKQKKFVVPFLDTEKLSTLFNYAYEKESLDYTIENQHKKMRQALFKARNDLRAMKKYKRPQSRILISYLK